MIVSAIDGRIRVVDTSLKNRKKAAVVEKKLKAVSAVTDVRVTPRIGSLLVYFDSSAMGRQEVQKRIRHHLQQIKQNAVRPAPGPLTGQRARRYVKYGLMASITGSIAFLMLDSEKWHYRTGTAFLTVLSLHLIQNRRRLLK